MRVNKNDKARVALNVRKENGKAGNQTIVLNAKEIENVYKKLLKKEIKFTKKLTKDGWGKNFAFADPDGNIIEVVER